MTEDKEIEKNLKDLDDICDECKEQDESVAQNLILTGFKIWSKIWQVVENMYVSRCAIAKWVKKLWWAMGL